MAKKSLPEEMCGSWWAVKHSGRTTFCKQEEAPERLYDGCYKCSNSDPSEVGWVERGDSFTVKGKKHKMSTLPLPPDCELCEGLNEIVVKSDRTYEVYEYI